MIEKMEKGAKYSCYSVNGGGTEDDEGIFELISLTKKQLKMKLIVEPIYGIDYKKGVFNSPSFLIYNQKKINFGKYGEEREKYKKEIEEIMKKWKENCKILVLKSKQEKMLEFIKQKEFTLYLKSGGKPFNFKLLENKN